jgi:hypothetical protein
MSAPAPEPPGHRGYKQAIAERMYDVLSQQMPDLFAPAAPPLPGVHLSPGEADQIATALGLASAVTGPAILTAIDRLASIRIGEIRIPFTPGQMAELQHRATKRGRTVEAEMRAVVARIEDELFYKGS